MLCVVDAITTEGVEGWASPALVDALGGLQRHRAELDAAEAQLLAELTARGVDVGEALGPMVSRHEAEARAATAVWLAHHPDAATRLAAGELRPGHIDAIVAAGELLADDKVPGLLAQAGSMPPGRFRGAIARAAAPSRAPSDATIGTTPQGRTLLRADLSALDGAVVHNALDAIIDQTWRTEHPPPDELPPYGQRLAAALVEMARRALAGGGGGRARADVVVVIDYDRLLADAETAGIATTIDGIPVPVGEIRRLLCDANVYPMVLSGASQIMDFGRSRRFFTKAQKLAMAARDRRCVFADCHRPIRYSDAHHLIPWQRGGTTDVNNAGPSCRHDHGKITTQGYAVRRLADGTINTYDPDGRLIHQRTQRRRE